MSAKKVDIDQLCDDLEVIRKKHGVDNLEIFFWNLIEYDQMESTSMDEVLFKADPGFLFLGNQGKYISLEMMSMMLRDLYKSYGKDKDFIEEYKVVSELVKRRKRATATG
jgi:hypothetical protein